MIEGVIRDFAQGSHQIWPIFRIYAPLRALADATTATTAASIALLRLAEALVEREVMPDRVFPPGRRLPEKGEMGEDPSVDVLDGQLLGRIGFDGHEDQAREGVRRFGVDVDHRIVRDVRRMRKRPGGMVVKRRRSQRRGGRTTRSVRFGRSMVIVVVVIAILAVS